MPGMLWNCCCPYTPKGPPGPYVSCASFAQLNRYCPPVLTVVTTGFGVPFSCAALYNNTWICTYNEAFGVWESPNDGTNQWFRIICAGVFGGVMRFDGGILSAGSPVATWYQNSPANSICPALGTWTFDLCFGGPCCPFAPFTATVS